VFPFESSKPLRRVSLLKRTEIESDGRDVDSLQAGNGGRLATTAGGCGMLGQPLARDLAREKCRCTGLALGGWDGRVLWAGAWRAATLRDAGPLVGAGRAPQHLFS
jgi:hypothetical protein